MSNGHISLKYDLLRSYWQCKPIRQIDKTLIYASDSSGVKYERIKMLIDSGANPNVHDFRKNSIGETPLMHLCDWNFTEEAKEDTFKCVKFLLENGADVNAKEAMERNALFHAAITGHLNILKLFVEDYRGNYLQLDRNKELPLHYAILSRDIKSVEYLKKISGMHYSCINPLAYALRHMHLSGCRLAEEIKIFILLIKDSRFDSTGYDEHRKRWILDLANDKLAWHTSPKLEGYASNRITEPELRHVLYARLIKDCLKSKDYKICDANLDVWVEKNFAKFLEDNKESIEQMSGKIISEEAYKSLQEIINKETSI